ncbi:hypothetical protein [Nocardiopsis sp. CNT312]|uniref:hypothetical protein n=1 Tax=Nocardiopsis sp. CNT312 TaxID=1137268 RepID=UPI0004B0F98A|nr:hypothetical protein [Nocardiopsis sp. CNT312]
MRALGKSGSTVSPRADRTKLRKARRTVIVPLYEEIKRGTLRSVLVQPGLSLEELRSLLTRPV